MAAKEMTKKCKVSQFQVCPFVSSPEYIMVGEIFVQLCLNVVLGTEA